MFEQKSAYEVRIRYWSSDGCSTDRAALFPLPSWRPRAGFDIDRALIYGIIRQESGFDRRARSARGARGLMQLMPRTASFVDEDDDLDSRHEQIGRAHV